MVDAKISVEFLTQRLGLQREQLWQAIVHQAYVEAWLSVAYALLGLLMCGAGCMEFGG